MTLNRDDIQIVELDLSTVCNAICPLCMRQSNIFKEQYSKPFFRDIDDIILQLKSFKNLSTVYLIGQMSEPTIHPEFLKLVSILKKLGYKLKINTNGSTNKDDFWEQLGLLLDYDDRVWFGICGSTQEIHSHYRIGTNLQDILRHAQKVRNKKPIDGAKCIRFRYNRKDFDSYEFKNMVSAFSFIEYTETCINNDINISSDFLPCQEVYKEYRQVESLLNFFNSQNKNILCQSIMENSIQINPYGEIFPCYRFLECGNKWDNADYNEILTGQFSVCRYCNKMLVEYADRNGLNCLL